MIDTLLHIAMKRLVPPCSGRLHEPMLYRIIMYIPDMSDKVDVVSVLMLPKALLPNRAFALVLMTHN